MSVVALPSARDEILARIASAIGEHRPRITVPREYRGDGGKAFTDLAGLFAERLSDYRAGVHHAAAGSIVDVVNSLLARRDGSRMIVPEGFPADWLPDGLTMFERVPTVDELDTADGVVTTCAVAVAETGTIVLDHGAGQGSRALTLVPDYHLVVVRSDQILGGVPDAIARLDPLRPQTWISGPSATSDIELDRVEGVHGPRQLEVVIITP